MAVRNHRITIEQASESLDSERAVTQTWSVVAVVWAAVTPLSGRELYSARQLHADVDYKIETQYRSGVTPKMRITWARRTFDIRQVVNVGERNRDLEILATERV